MFLICFLSIFLPYLNRDGCDTPGIGYTCKDLDDGVKKLEKLLTIERKYNSSFSAHSKIHGNQMIIRLRAVILALATNTRPLIAPCSIDTAEIPINDKRKTIVDFPSISIPTKKIKASKIFPLCYDETNITGNVKYTETMPITIDYLLFNPAMHRLTQYLGPAAFHILIHYALNLSTYQNPNTNQEELIFKAKKKKPFFGILSPMSPTAPCIDTYLNNQSVERNSDTFLEVPVDPILPQIIDLVNADEFAFQISDPLGFIISILRGYPSYIYDPVSRTCHKGRSIISGALNPLYSSIYSSQSDFSVLRDTFCGDPNITKEVLKQLL